MSAGGAENGVGDDMATAKWVMHDGKRHKDYATIEALPFSPDSSTLAYIAGNRTRQFMVSKRGRGRG